MESTSQTADSYSTFRHVHLDRTVPEMSLSCVLEVRIAMEGEISRSVRPELSNRGQVSRIVFQRLSDLSLQMRERLFLLSVLVASCAIRLDFLSRANFAHQVTTV